MRSIILALAALAGSAAPAQAQVSAGDTLPQAMQGRWALNARACTRGDSVGRGVIDVNDGGYVSDGERNAAIRRLIRTRGNRRTYEVIFSAVADRMWPGVMTVRMVGPRLGITNGRNAEKLYVRCPG